MDKNYIIDSIKGSLGDDYTVTFKTVEKNNCIKEGINIAKVGTNVAPTFYYRDDDSDDDIIKSVLAAYRAEEESGRISNFDISQFEDFEFIKDKIIPVLYNKTMNKYDDLLTTDFVGDIGIYFRIMLGGGMSTKVLKVLVNAWNVTAGDVMETAKKNLNSQLYLQDMMNVQMELMGLAMAPSDERIIDMGDSLMSVISNKLKMFGASGVLLLPQLIKNGEIEKKDYVIIPSSIHECILLNEVEEGFDVNALIEDVNATQLQAEDVLSNRAFVYKADTETFEAYIAA